MAIDVLKMQHIAFSIHFRETQYYEWSHSTTETTLFSVLVSGSHGWNCWGSVTCYRLGGKKQLVTEILDTVHPLRLNNPQSVGGCICLHPQVERRWGEPILVSPCARTEASSIWPFPSLPDYWGRSSFQNVVIFFSLK